MEIENKIIKLKKIAFLLFLCGSLSIVGSLLFHNYLINYIFYHYANYNIMPIDDEPGSNITTVCNENNEYCTSESFIKKNTAPVGLKLNDCFIHEVKNIIIVDGQEYSYVDAKEVIFIDLKSKKIKENFQNKNIIYKKIVLNEKNIHCIKNYNSYFLYKIFPLWYEQISKLKLKLKKEKLTLGSSVVINPFFYGETSISNVAKRFPINIIFKSFLYIAVILMIFYWLNYNFLFKKILNKTRNHFFYYGIASSVFLFLHVLFLGVEIDNEIFQKLRRLIIILFILNELFAQISLTRQLYKNSKNLINYCYLNIIKLKILFITAVISISVLVISILVFYDLESKVDYILEWNYFLGLLFYYFLSSIMWKKIN